MFSVGISSSVCADVGVPTRILFLSVDIILMELTLQIINIMLSYDLPYIFPLSLAHVIHDKPIREYDKEVMGGKSRMRMLLHFDSRPR